jgi:hypothetical protein
MRTGTSRRLASAKASPPQGHQSTGLLACWRRYGEVALPSRFTATSSHLSRGRNIRPGMIHATRCCRPLPVPGNSLVSAPRHPGCSGALSIVAGASGTSFPQGRTEQTIWAIRGDDPAGGAELNHHRRGRGQRPVKHDVRPRSNLSDIEGMLPKRDRPAPWAPIGSIPVGVGSSSPTSATRPPAPPGACAPLGHRTGTARP